MPRSTAARRINDSARSFGMAVSAITAIREVSESLKAFNHITAVAMSALKFAAPLSECLRRTINSARKARLSQTKTLEPAQNPIG